MRVFGASMRFTGVYSDNLSAEDGCFTSYLRDSNRIHFIFNDRVSNKTVCLPDANDLLINF